MSKFDPSSKDYNPNAQSPLQNFQNPWDALGDYAQQFLNVDSILDVSEVLNVDKILGLKNKLFSKEPEKVPQKPKPTTYINVVTLPKAKKNNSFSTEYAIATANNILLQLGYLKGAEKFGSLLFRAYTGAPKQMTNCIVIGQDHIELKANIEQYTSTQFFQYCGKLLSSNSNIKIIDEQGNETEGELWNPEIASTNDYNGGFDNQGIVRLDHLAYIGAENILVNGIHHIHSINLAFLLLHILGHNAHKTGHVSGGGLVPDMGIMLSGIGISGLLFKIKDEIDNGKLTMPTTAILELMKDKPNDLNYLTIPLSELDAKYNNSTDHWIENHGNNGRYIHGLFNHFAK